MIKNCPHCKQDFEGNAKKKYCSLKCKKTFENSKRIGPKAKEKKDKSQKYGPPSIPVNRPHNLNQIAGAYWDKIAPTLIERGHLNVLSEDAFAELCDLHSRLVDIRTMIDAGTVQKCKKCGDTITIPGNRSLLQLDDKWDNKSGTESQSFKESALSDLKRKYSQRFLEYCKQFYLTPLSNRGDFGLTELKKEKDDEKPSKERFF